MENRNIISAFVIVLVLIGGVIFYLNKTPRAENGAGGGNESTNLNLVAGPIVGSVKSETLGEYLTDTTGMTLYVFADDKKLQSSCVGDCSQKWPPFIYDNKDVASFTDTLSKRMNVIPESADRWATYAYGEKPVYYYIGDKKPGEVNGNGLNDGKWSIVPITP
ncbi:MAG: hypothetical protein G01um101424_176 [Parcubacteria group bacterium Gr01-1014_24]|nr:MAG: hypothetical protein G01um101424_176 [Parcubacteria group bacterium Gr01-1014_24]